MISALKIGICGLGLIGGSLAKAFRRKSGITFIYALDSDEGTINKAIKDNIITRGSTIDYNIFDNCDVVFICTPINSVVDNVMKIAKISNCLISDTASIKGNITANIPDNIRFIGGHPMAGSEQSGYMASSETLFENAVYIISKIENTTDADYQLMTELINSIGAITIDLDAISHDKAVGMISHLPHIVAATLVNSVSDKDKDGLLQRLAAGGFKDITRIASSESKLWEQILSSSGEIIIDILNDYKCSVEDLIDILNKRDSVKLTDYLDRAKNYRDNIISSRKGMLPTVSEIYVEVSDKPGIIGNIATLLGNNSINIKNLYIENNREYEGGSMRITLEKASDSDRAVAILNDNNYISRAR